MARLFAIIAILSFFVVALVKGLDKHEFIGEFLARMSECKEEVGAQDSDIEEMFKASPASTHEGKCLRSCLMKKYEAMDENGKLNKNGILAHFDQFEDVPEEKIKVAQEIVDKCGELEVSEDHCEAAQQYDKCLKDEAMASDLKDDFKF